MLPVHLSVRLDTPTLTARRRIPSAKVARIEAKTLSLSMSRIGVGSRADSAIRSELMALGRLAGNRAVERQMQRQKEATEEALQKITTPLGKQVRLRRGGLAALRAGGISIVFKPDATSTDEKMKGHAETDFDFDFAGWKYKHKDDIITESNPWVELVIQTTYGPGASREAPSGYGRGTTAEDIQAGQTTLGFHEGSHGLFFIQYVTDHSLPGFKGKTGMSLLQYKDLIGKYKDQLAEYGRKMKQEAVAQGDCVGVIASFCEAVGKVKESK